MTTYTTITDTETGHKKPLTVSLMRRLRDNPIAISEGAAGAPRVDPINAMAHQGAANAVGTYMLAVWNASINATLDFGATLAGSSLDPVGINNEAGTSRYDVASVSTIIPAGTWRCMGYATNNTTGQRTISLWLRIA